MVWYAAQLFCHILYRMYLIAKAALLHPFSATVVDFEKGTIELEQQQANQHGTYRPIPR